jgi:hypothetical protein
MGTSLIVDETHDSGFRQKLERAMPYRSPAPSLRPLTAPDQASPPASIERPQISVFRRKPPRSRIIVGGGVSCYGQTSAPFSACPDGYPFPLRGPGWRA